MKQWAITITESAVIAIDTMAMIVILAGTVEAFLAGVRLMIGGTINNQDGRAIWLRYARWLVAGLTFQLAADIIESSIAANWESIGRLAAIAVIRTFLNFFLERDVAEIRERQHEGTARSYPENASEGRAGPP